MTDPIEEMKKAGWILDEDLSTMSEVGLVHRHSEIKIFHRPNQKPNAVVDWELLETQLEDMETGRGFIAISQMPVARATLQGAASDIRRAIKKA